MSSVLRELGQIMAGFALVFLLFLALDTWVKRAKKREKPPDE